VPGLAALRDERGRRREERFGQLVAFWRSLQGNAFWTELEKILQSRDRLTPPPADDVQQEEPHGPEETGQDNSAAQ
jgi:hypothetical protein